jgi:site-specific recombinase XerD
MNGALIHAAGDRHGSVGLRLPVPALVTLQGERAAMRYVEFFTVSIRNPNTRAAYARAAAKFLLWCEELGVSLCAIQPVHVAAHVERLGQQLAAPTVKQQLAALRILFDWLVIGQIVPSNPAANVRGPSHVVGTGKTPMPTREEAKALLANIPADTLIGLRDHALVATLLYTFSRVSAALAMRVEDYYPVGKQWWAVVHVQFAAAEMKNRRGLEFPWPPALLEALRTYLTVHRPVLLAGQSVQELWVGRQGRLTYSGCRQVILQATEETIGHAVPPHFFRDSAATTIALHDPEHVGIIPALLGHTTPRTAEQHYNHATSVVAARTHQQTIARLRRDGRGRRRRRHRDLDERTR